MIRYKGITIDRKLGLISHRGRSKSFPSHNRFRNNKGVAFRIWEALILDDMSRYKLFDHAYGRCSEGGPIAGENVIDVRISQWKPDFARMLLRLNREKRGGLKFYRLVPIDVV